MNFFKDIWPWYLLLPLAVVFFLGTSYLNFRTQEYATDPSWPDYVKWASPDETANYVFAKLYAQTGELRLFEKYNLIAGDIIQPRSMRSDSGDIKPVSFLGIILFYGTLARYTSYKLIPFFTPFLAALGLIFYYLLIKKLFSRANAVISAFILAAFPVYTYYSVRSMFHNVLFVSALLIGLYLAAVCLSDKSKKARYLDLFRSPRKPFSRQGFFAMSFDYKRLPAAFASGLFIGLAIMARTSELIWLLPLLAFLALVNWPRLGLYRVLLIGGGITLALLPMFYYNQLLYGSALLGGYAEMNRSIVDIKDSGAGLAGEVIFGQLDNAKVYLRSIFDSVFVFGFHPEQSFFLANKYVYQMFPLLAIAAAFGFVVYVFGNGRKYWRHLWLFLGLAIASLILIIYYGSWKFSDNPNQDAYTIGNSYTRYWLPIYLGMIPFASYLIVRVTHVLSQLRLKRERDKNGPQLSLFSKKKRFRPVIARLALRSLAVGAFIVISLDFVLAGSEEGLVYLYAKQKQDKYEWEHLLDLTESNSVIITRYHDKLMFPERKVVVGLFDDPNMLARYVVLVRHLPTYYYNFRFSAKDFEYLNTRRLKSAGLYLEPIENITPVFTLYRFKAAEPEKPKEIKSEL